ncbi:hypothetical protein DIPPA_28868 [Diplonema papillatum]|nr:hypothetical protein DIPPA_28868 [Diplonema papillatum]
MGSITEFCDALLEAINEVRRVNSACALRREAGLDGEAQRLAALCFGKEILRPGVNTWTRPVARGQIEPTVVLDVVKDWYAGVRDYDQQGGGFTACLLSTGAMKYTNLLWSCSSRVGLACAFNGSTLSVAAAFNNPFPLPTAPPTPEFLAELNALLPRVNTLPAAQRHPRAFDVARNPFREAMGRSESPYLDTPSRGVTPALSEPTCCVSEDGSTRWGSAAEPAPARPLFAFSRQQGRPSPLSPDCDPAGNLAHHQTRRQQGAARATLPRSPDCYPGAAPRAVSGQRSATPSPAFDHQPADAVRTPPFLAASRPGLFQSRGDLAHGHPPHPSAAPPARSTEPAEPAHMPSGPWGGGESASAGTQSSRQPPDPRKAAGQREATFARGRRGSDEPAVRTPAPEPRTQPKPQQQPTPEDGGNLPARDFVGPRTPQPAPRDGGAAARRPSPSARSPDERGSAGPQKLTPQPATNERKFAATQEDPQARTSAPQQFAGAPVRASAGPPRGAPQTPQGGSRERTASPQPSANECRTAGTQAHPQARAAAPQLFHAGRRSSAGPQQGAPQAPQPRENRCRERTATLQPATNEHKSAGTQEHSQARTAASQLLPATEHKSSAGPQQDEPQTPQPRDRRSRAEAATPQPACNEHSAGTQDHQQARTAAPQLFPTGHWSTAGRQQGAPPTPAPQPGPSSRQPFAAERTPATSHSDGGGSRARPAAPPFPQPGRLGGGSAGSGSEGCFEDEERQAGVSAEADRLAHAAAERAAALFRPVPRAARRESIVTHDESAAEDADSAPTRKPAGDPPPSGFWEGHPAQCPFGGPGAPAPTPQGPRPESTITHDDSAAEDADAAPPRKPAGEHPPASRPSPGGFWEGRTVQCPFGSPPAHARRPESTITHDDSAAEDADAAPPRKPAGEHPSASRPSPGGFRPVQCPFGSPPAHAPRQQGPRPESIITHDDSAAEDADSASARKPAGERPMASSTGRPVQCPFGNPPAHTPKTQGPRPESIVRYASAASRKHSASSAGSGCSLGRLTASVLEDTPCASSQTSSTYQRSAPGEDGSEPECHQPPLAPAGRRGGGGGGVPLCLPEDAATLKALLAASLQAQHASAAECERLASDNAALATEVRALRKVLLSADGAPSTPGCTPSCTPDRRTFCHSPCQTWSRQSCCRNSREHCCCGGGGGEGDNEVETALKIISDMAGGRRSSSRARKSGRRARAK